MAAVDYSGILTSMKAIFEADSRTNMARVYVEEDPQFGMSDNGQAIVITMVSRSPMAGQAIAAGKRTRYLARIGVWSVGFDMASYQEACSKRDAILEQVELVLMANRTLGGTVTASNLEGGEFMSVRNPGDNVFCAMAETAISAEVSAINT
jgi:hypothetical protein